MKKKLALVVLASSALFAQGTITTYAGGGQPQNFGVATSVMLANPNGVARDSAGNLYVVSNTTHAAYRISPAGRITRIAGSGEPGFSGDNGPAVQARLLEPCSIAVDVAGTIYISDLVNNRVRSVDSAGIIRTIAGNCTQGGEGNGIPAASACIGSPLGIAVSAAGDVYFADSTQRIRRIAAGTGLLYTIAGTGEPGYNGDGIAATSARVNDVTGLAFDANGRLLVADAGNHRIRSIDLGSGIISTIAGTGDAGYNGDGIPATSAQIGRPEGVSAAAGQVYIAEEGGNRVRKIDATGAIATVAGDGTGSDYNGDGIPATTAKLWRPTSIVALPNGDFWFTERGGSRLRRVTAGIINTAAGIGPSGNDGLSRTQTQFSEVKTPFADASGSVFVSDDTNARIFQVSAAGVTTTAIGTGVRDYGADGVPASSSPIGGVRAMTRDLSGDFVFADTSTHRVRRIDKNTGIVTTLAGNGNPTFNGDNVQATAAGIDTPLGVAYDALGNLYIATQARVRMVNAGTGLISTVAGTGVYGYSGDGVPATAAQLGSVQGIGVDSAGNIYISDSNYNDGANNRIRKIDAVSQIITTLAGGGTSDADDIPGLQAYMSHVLGMALDASGGNIFFAELYAHRVRRFSLSTGRMTNVVAGPAGYSGDGGPSTQAQIRYPIGVSAAPDGRLYVVDAGNYRVRSIAPTVAVTLNTNPQGLNVTVDGVQYTAPKTLYLMPGSTVRVTAPLVQSTGVGSVRFSSWSDGGAFTHNVTIPANGLTLTANYQ